MGINEPENIQNDASQSKSPSNVLGLSVVDIGRPPGYARPFYPDLPPDGSVFSAAFRRHTTIGNYLNSVDFTETGDAEPEYDYLANIPIDLFERYGHMYAATKNKQEAEQLTNNIRSELHDEEVMSNRPISTFFSTFLVNLVDPTILMPGGTLYKSAKASVGAAKSALSVGAAGLAAGAVGAAVEYKTQLPKPIDHYFYETLGAGIISAAIGGVGGAFKSGAIFNKAKKEVVNEMAAELPIGPRLTPDQALSAMKTRDPDYQKELNSLYGKTPTAAIGKFLGYVTKELTPQGRLLFSPFGTSRAIANELLEHNLIINANLPGKRKMMGPDGVEVEVPRGAMAKPIAVESEIKEMKRGMYKSLIDYQNIFYEQAGIKGPFKGMQEKFKKEGKDIVTWEKEVWRSIVSGKESNDASVERGVDLIIKRFFDPIKNEYIRLGVFPEDITPRTAASYFMRVYNREKIRDPAQRAKTKAKFESWIKRNNEELKALTPEIERLKKEIEQLELGKAKIKKKEAKEKIKELKEELDKLVPYYLKNSKGEIRQVIHEDYYSVEAENIIDHILGMGEERAFNPIMQRLSGTKSNPLQERVLLIDDLEIEDELITSFIEIAPIFINATVPHIALLRYAERLGLKGGAEAKGLKITQLEEDYKLAVERNPENEKKLYNQFQKDKKDILALFDILQGVYGNGVNVLDSKASTFVKNLSTWNYMRLMGMITLQALTDAGAIGIKHGLFRTLSQGFLPVLKELKNGGFDKELLQDLGFVTNTLTGYRLKTMIDQDPVTGKTGLFTRSLSNLSAAYGNMTLMNQWTDAMEFIAGKVSIARTLRAINEFSLTGKVKEKESTRLNELGINQQHYKKIHEQWQKHGGETDGSFWIDWTKWDTDNESLAALREFRAAIIKEIDQTVVSGPGIGEKPLYSRTGWGSLLFQFKGFSYAMTNKVLISGLQRNDAEFYTGIMMLGALGLLSYGATSLARGEEMDLDPDVLFREMIDRSGITGVFGNFYNTMNKLGLIPGKEVSRYKNRGLFSTLGGPSVGIIEDNIALLSKLMHIDEKDFNTNDMYKFFRNFPYQNYWFLHRLNRATARQLADFAGFEESPE